MNMFHYAYHGDWTYKFTISADEIDAGPMWESSEECPPLPPRQAIAEARRLMARLFPDIDEKYVRFDGCSLRRLDSARWYYLVGFFIPAEEPGCDDQLFDIPVLFSGRGLLPEKVKDWLE